jgi:hypothetical protein
MPDLKDIIADSQYKDDQLINVLGQQYTLGSLRTLTKGQQAALDKQEKELADKQAKMDKDLKDLQAAQRTTGELYAQLEQQRLAAGGQPKGNNEPDPLDRLEQDNIIGPLVKHSKALKAQLAATEAKNAEILKGMQNMAGAYLNDRLTDVYERVVPEADRAKFSQQALIEYGMQNKYTTSSGYVDIKRAYMEQTAGSREAQSAKEAEERGYQKALEEMKAKGIVVGQPAGGGGIGDYFVANDDKRPASTFKSLDEAFASPDLKKDWNQFDGKHITN